MKISKLFHWLYFFVMALPLVVAPIFALYTTNKNATFGYTATDVVQKEVRYNQMFNVDNLPSSLNGLVFTINDGLIDIDGTSLNESSSWTSFYNFSAVSGHSYMITINGGFNASSTDMQRVAVLDESYSSIHSFNSSSTYYSFVSNTNVFRFSIGPRPTITYDFSLYIQVFDLTSMNLEDISYADFSEIFTEPYYAYTLDSYVVIDDYSVTYNENDIGSQFIYSMYNCVDKYFNYDRVFNFGDLYSWLNATFFSGAAPLGFFIFWHLLIYWLLTSLLWLLFDVLMYVPLLIHRWLDKASLS